VQHHNPEKGYKGSIRNNVKGDTELEKRSYAWFERRRRTKALDLAQEQITKALDTVTLLHQAIKNMSEAKKKEALQNVENLFRAEREVDNLRMEVFKELSKGAALFAEYREDLMHLVKRLDTLADHVKDVARCLKMLSDSDVPKELWDNAVHMTSTLVSCAHALRGSIEKVTVNPTEAIEGANKVDGIEHEIDEEYLKIKTLFPKCSEKMDSGSMVIFDDLVEFIEEAADMCADTADYIVILSSRE
jgi:predicted phosphate transport protein (TIGR00153 family)